MVDALGVTAVDRRSGSAMAEALIRAKRARAEDLLPFLDDETLHRACNAFQVRAEQTRQRTIERLVETDVYRASGSEVALHTCGPFVAMTVWCADHGRDSLCAIHASRVEGGKVTAELREHIRPPRRRITGAAAAAGLDWTQLKQAPKLADVWPALCAILDDTSFIAAHNGSFLRSVLATSSAEARLKLPSLPVQCTARLARRMWDLPTANLNAVLEHLQASMTPDVLASTTQCAVDVVLSARRAARR